MSSDFETIGFYSEYFSEITEASPFANRLQCLIQTNSLNFSGFSCCLSSGQVSGQLRNQAAPVNHSISSSWDTAIPRVPISAGFSVPFTRLHSSTVELSKISPSLFATKSCRFLWAECNHSSAVKESVQWYTFPISMSWPSRMSYLNLTAYKAACNSTIGTVFCLVGATPHFPVTKLTSTPLNLWSEICNHAHRFQRGVWENMKVNWIRFFMEITSINFSVFQLLQFVRPVLKTHFAILGGLFVSQLTEFRPKCLQQNSHSHCEGRKSFKEIKNRRYKRQNPALFYLPGDFFRCATTYF